ncbi:MAG: aldo/keto reductase [Rikenellaceae bacterium]
MKYNRCGKSGLLMPAISLGLWHNFSSLIDNYDNAKEIVFNAYDNGVVQFDLANNYGPPAGAAEEMFGRILKDGFSTYRNKILITTKAGHTMWEGVYGDWGSRKHLIASCDESLERLGVKYVDVFYSHRYDPQTPLEETMRALDHIVRSGRALYIGLSKYPVDKMREALVLLDQMGTPVIVDQQKYSLLVRKPESEHLDFHSESGLGFVSFSPLAQGQLSERYLNGIPLSSRAAKETGFLQEQEVHQNMDKVLALKEIANCRNQTLSQMALSWQLRDDRVTSVIIGVSRLEQLTQNLKALDNLSFTQEELQKIDAITL